MVTVTSTQTVGQPLTLECVGATVRGITSRVDIVWRRGNVHRPIKSTRRTATKMDNLLVYTDNYTISQLSTTDEGVVYQCILVIRKSYLVRVTDTVRLNVTGEYFVNVIYDCVPVSIPSERILITGD